MSLALASTGCGGDDCEAAEDILVSCDFVTRDELRGAECDAESARLATEFVDCVSMTSGDRCAAAAACLGGGGGGGGGDDGPAPGPGGCTNTCSFADDGDCDDGGPGSDFSVCDFGTDCGDCGPR
ncbi:MAG: hypothetical protein AAF645_11455 [Myxococcota bacterium]